MNGFLSSCNKKIKRIRFEKNVNVDSKKSGKNFTSKRNEKNGEKFFDDTFLMGFLKISDSGVSERSRVEFLKVWIILI